MANDRFSKQYESSQHNESSIKLEYKLDDDVSLIKIKDISFKNIDHRYMNK